MFTNLFHHFLGPPIPKFINRWPLPSTKGCRPPPFKLMSMDFGWEWQVGNERGDPWCGRPTRYAGRQTRVGLLPPSSSLAVLTTKIHQDACHRLHSLLPHTTGCTANVALAAPSYIRMHAARRTRCFRMHAARRTRRDHEGDLRP